MLPRQLITAILLLCVLAFAFFAYSIGSYMLLAIGVLLPPLLMFSARVDLIAFWVVALYLSTLTLPGMPIDLQMYQLMMVFFVIAAMAQRIVVKWPYPTPPGRGWVLLLIVFLAVLIRIRGLGLRVMGGSLVGGAAYVHLFLAIGFYLLSGGLTLTAKQWKRAMVTMIALIAVPVILNLTVVLSGGKFWYPLLFIRITFALVDTFRAMQQDATAARWSIFNPLVVIYLMPALLFPFVKKNYKYYALFFVVAACSAMISGVRQLLLQALLFMTAFLLLSSRRRFMTLMVFGLCGLVGLGILVVLVEHLPYGVQRVMTMVPGVRVSAAAEMAAAETLEWRLMLWKLAMADLPKYLLIGRGFAYNLADSISAVQHQYMTMDAVRSALMQGDLHMGPMAVIYSLGTPVLFVFIGLVVTAMVWHVRRHKAEWFDADLRRYHFVWLVQLSTNLALYSIAGAARNILPAVLFQLAILHGLAISDSRLAPVKEEPPRRLVQPRRNAEPAAGGPPGS